MKIDFAGVKRQAFADGRMDDIIDEDAVRIFANAMSAKLKKKRGEGKRGWWTDEVSDTKLVELFIEHVGKGDPVDIANFCMFLYCREVPDSSVRSALGNRLQQKPNQGVMSPAEYVEHVCDNLFVDSRGFVRTENGYFVCVLCLRDRVITEPHISAQLQGLGSAFKKHINPRDRGDTGDIIALLPTYVVPRVT